MNERRSSAYVSHRHDGGPRHDETKNAGLGLNAWRHESFRPHPTATFPNNEKCRLAAASRFVRGRSALPGHITHGAGIGRGGKYGIGLQGGRHIALRSTGFTPSRPWHPSPRAGERARRRPQRAGCCDEDIISIVSLPRPGQSHRHVALRRSVTDGQARGAAGKRPSVSNAQTLPRPRISDSWW